MKSSSERDRPGKKIGILPAVEIRGIEKTYPSTGRAGPICALKGIDLTIERGTIFCVLGPNGAGKTTLISILAGLILPDAGEGLVWGLNLLKERRKIRAVVNFASGQANLPDNFTSDEILNYFGMLYGLPKKERRRKTEELVVFFELDRHRKIPFNQLSTGLKQRLALAKSLINDPAILFLDEPTSRLDPAVALLISSRLIQWRLEHDTTIILTTHQMDEADQLSDRIAFLKEGRIIRIGGADDLKQSIAFQRRLIIEGRNLEGSARMIEELEGLALIEASESRLICRMESGEESLNPILEKLLSTGAVLDNLEMTKPTLGDVFIELANRSDSD